MGVLTGGLVGAAAVVACAAAAPAPRLWLVHGPGRPVAGRATSIVVGARSGVHTKVKVWIARDSAVRSFASRAQTRGRYRSLVVFPTGGRWTFGARAHGIPVRPGATSASRAGSTSLPTGPSMSPTRARIASSTSWPMEGRSHRRSTSFSTRTTSRSRAVLSTSSIPACPAGCTESDRTAGQLSSRDHVELPGSPNQGFTSAGKSLILRSCSLNGQLRRGHYR